MVGAITAVRDFKLAILCRAPAVRVWAGRRQHQGRAPPASAAPRWGLPS